MKKKLLQTSSGRSAFSLIEVVVAVGIFGIAVVALMGVLSATGKTVSDLADSDVAAKIALNVEAEMRRYASTRPDFDDFATAIPLSGATPLELFATRDGSRVLLDAAAGTNVDGTNDAIPTGIYGRDRYYLLKINRMAAPLDYTAGDGFVALSVMVEWPYQLPLGPPDPTSGNVGNEGTDYSVTPDEDRNVYLLNVAITP